MSRRLPLTLDEAEEMQEWLGAPSFSYLVDKVLPSIEGNLVRSLGSTELDSQKLLLARAKIEGARELIKAIHNLKQTLRGQKE